MRTKIFRTVHLNECEMFDFKDILICNEI